MENIKKPEDEKTIAENLSAVGQIILGEMEKIGGILTGDPITNAEGDFNIAAGAAHQEVNREILAADREHLNKEANKKADHD